MHIGHFHQFLIKVALMFDMYIYTFWGKQYWGFPFGFREKSLKQKSLEILLTNSLFLESLFCHSNALKSLKLSKSVRKEWI